MLCKSLFENQWYEPQSKPWIQGFAASRGELTSHRSSAPWRIKKDPFQYSLVQTIAGDSLHAGYSSARAILTLIDDKQYPEVILSNLSSKSYRLRRNEVAFSNGQILLRNYPNPFDNETTIEVQVDDKLVKPELIVYDLVGNIIFKSGLHGGFNTLNLSDNNLKSGIYFYSLVSGNKKIATEKMISLK